MSQPKKATTNKMFLIWFDFFSCYVFLYVIGLFCVDSTFTQRRFVYILNVVVIACCHITLLLFCFWLNVIITVNAFRGVKKPKTKKKKKEYKKKSNNNNKKKHLSHAYFYKFFLRFGVSVFFFCYFAVFCFVYLTDDRQQRISR